MKKGGQMQKSSLVALIMGTVSGVLFALGMCMCLVWEQIVWGTLIGLLGIIMLIALIPMIKGIKLHAALHSCTTMNENGVQ